MNDKLALYDTYDRNTFSTKDYYKMDDESYLTERDFYPHSDDRVVESYVEDIDGGDNFADYCEYIFEMYEEEGYWD